MIQTEEPLKIFYQGHVRRIIPGKFDFYVAHSCTQYSRKIKQRRKSSRFQDKIRVIKRSSHKKLLVILARKGSSPATSINHLSFEVAQL